MSTVDGEAAAGTGPGARVHLAFVPLDESDRDIHAVAEEATAVVAALRSDGYTLTPHATGERGGPVFDVLQQVGQTIHDYKDLLVAVCELAAAVFVVRGATAGKGKHPSGGQSPQPMVPAQPASTDQRLAPQIVIEIHRVSIPVDPDAPCDAVALAEQIRRALPAAGPALPGKATPEGSVPGGDTARVVVRVPPRPKRRRR